VVVQLLVVVLCTWSTDELNILIFGEIKKF